MTLKYIDDTNMMKGLSIYGLFIVFWFCMASIVYAQSEPLYWDMPTSSEAGSFHTAILNAFVKDVEKATHGRLKIHIHAGGSLFRHIAIPRAVHIADVQMGEFSLSLLADEEPILGVDMLPFLATNAENAMQLWAAQKTLIAPILDKKALKILFTLPWPGFGIYTKKPVQTLADFKGIHFKADNPVLEAFIKAIGATPIPLYATGAPKTFIPNDIEAMIASPLMKENGKSFPFLPYYMDIQAWYPKTVIAVNKHFFSYVDEDIQDALLQAAKHAEMRGWARDKAQAKSFYKILKEKGVDITIPSKELMATLKAIGQQMFIEWKQDVGPNYYFFLDDYQKKHH